MDSVDRAWDLVRHPITHPPDFSHRKILENDYYAIKALFEDSELHFTEPFLKYQQVDHDLEEQIWL